MRKIRNSFATFTVILALGAPAAQAGSLLDKAKNAAKSVGKAATSAAKKVESAAQSTADAASSTAYSVKSIAKAAVHGVEHFDKSVKTTGLDTPGLRAMCPGITQRLNGCSVPLYDKITKQFQKLLFDACQDHDLCYLVTDAKQACDVAFRDRMYKTCDKLSVKKTYGLCRVAAHTWFAAVTHAKEATKRHKIERDWARANCTPVPELAKKPLPQ